MKHQKLNNEEIEKLSMFVKAMAHPTRMWILQFLSRQNCCFSGEIADELPYARSTISEHLRQLKAAGLIQGEIEHPKIRYCINKANWGMAKQMLDVLFSFEIDSEEVKLCNLEHTKV